MATHIDERLSAPPEQASTGPDEHDASITHPEEMRASFNLRIGNGVSLQGAARTTPAGIATVGITVAVIIASVGLLVWASRKRF